MSFKAAAIQMRSGVDPARNAADMERLVRAAAAEGAVYVQTPEMTGAIQKDRQALRAQLRDDDGDIIVATAARLAGELGIHVHVGSTAIARPDGKIANRGFLFAPDGSRICSYDKIHMFDVDLDNGESWRESAAYQPGEVARIAELPLGKFGFAICYDVRFPQLFRAEALAGAEVLTVPAAFTRQTGKPIGKSCCAPAPSKMALSSSPPRRLACMRTGARPSATPSSLTHGARFWPLPAALAKRSSSPRSIRRWWLPRVAKFPICAMPASSDWTLSFP